MFRNIGAWKVFMKKKEKSFLSVGKILSHSAEKYREGNHSRFQKY